MALRPAAAAVAVLLSGCQHHEEAAGPAGLPYACGDGRAARIYYDGGDPNRSPARLEFDGRTVLLRPAPAMSGLRYRSESGLVWSAQGDEARLSEANPDGSEREVARCARIRDGATAPPPEHGEDH